MHFIILIIFDGSSRNYNKYFYFIANSSINMHLNLTNYHYSISYQHILSKLLMTFRESIKT